MEQGQASNFIFTQPYTECLQLVLIVIRLQKNLDHQSIIGLQSPLQLSNTWDIYMNIVHCTSPVFVVWQCKSNQ